MEWAEQRMPKPTDEDYAEGVRYAQALCNRHGITGVIDACVEERHARVYRKLDRDGKLTVRVGATAKVNPREAVADAVGRLSQMRAESAGRMLAVHSAKFFLDGVLENRTAAMLEPYSDAIGGNAPLMFDYEHMKALFAAFDAARFQIHIHTIGDAALRAALDGLEHARRLNGQWPGLHQIAHVQCIDAADIPRFRTVGAMANIQSLWARHEPSVTDVALPMIGEQRGRLMYAFRSLLDAGAACALSSDWGVSTLNPFEIMETGCTRQPPGKQSVPVFLPEQRMTIEECVRGYTLAAAAAAWRADSTGSLGTGKQADLIVLDRDIFECPQHEIGATQVLLTLLSGEEVHRAAGFDG
jgi:predicted amidohydrolase YtcJ